MLFRLSGVVLLLDATDTLLGFVEHREVALHGELVLDLQNHMLALESQFFLGGAFKNRLKLQLVTGETLGGEVLLDD